MDRFIVFEDNKMMVSDKKTEGAVIGKIIEAQNPEQAIGFYAHENILTGAVTAIRLPYGNDAVEVLPFLQLYTI